MDETEHPTDATADPATDDVTADDAMADDATHEMPDAEAPPKVLRRRADGRVAGGVAAGIADYLGIDPLIVRIAFVVLAFVGGSGVLLYLAGWLLIPATTGEVIARDWAADRPPRRSVLVMVLGIVLAVIAVSNLFASGPWWPHWNHGIGFFLGLVALTLALVLVVTSSTKRSPASRLRWFGLSAIVSVVALVALAVATLFTVQALSGVPLHGGIGDTQWRPTTASRVAKKYELAVGNLTVDLRDVTFNPGTTHVTATVGIGRVVVDLPPGPIVSVTAHSGLGNVHVFGHDDGGLGTRTTVRSGQSSDVSVRGETPPVRIVLDAEAGVGRVEVVRGG